MASDGNTSRVSDTLAYHIRDNINLLATAATNVGDGSHTHWPLVLVNLLLSAYLIWRIRFHALLIHINLRIVLCYTYFIQYNLIALGRLADEANVFLVTNGCTGSACVVFSNLICLASKLLHDTGIMLAANSDLIVLLERLVATLMPSSYETKNARIGTTIVVTFYTSCFTLVALVAFYDALIAGFGIWTSHGSCQSAALHPGFLVVFWWWAVSASYIGTVALLYLYRYNKQQVAHWLGSGKLSLRYQFGENVRTLRAILPAIVLNAAFFTLGLYFVINYLITGNDNVDIAERIADEIHETETTTITEERANRPTPISKSFVFKFVYAFADVYGLLFAVIFILRSKSVLNILRQDLLILLPCCHPYSGRYRNNNKSTEISKFSTQLTSNHTSRNRWTLSINDNAAQKAKISDEYFKQLHNMWN